MRLLSPFLFVGLGLVASAPAQDHVLRGTLDGSDHQTYRELPFAVPEGVGRITVEFDYSGREQKTTIDSADLLDDATVVGEAAGLAFRWRSDGARHWLRVDVRDADGKLALVGNPIYVNFSRAD